MRHKTNAWTIGSVLRRRSMVGSVIVGGVAVTVSAAVIMSGGNAATTTSPPPGTNLVPNGSFEQGMTGWRTNAASQRLAITAGGKDGTRQAVISTATQQTVALNDVKNTIASTKAGTSYRLTALVSTDRPPMAGALRVREVTGAQATTFSSDFQLNSTTWKMATLDFTTKTTGSSLDLNVVGWQIPAGKSLHIDAIMLVERGGSQPPTPTPTATATPRPTTSASPSVSPTRPPTATPTATATATPTSPPAGGAPLLGIYSGGPSTDDGVRTNFGTYPDIASTYYQGNQSFNVTAEKARSAKGILPFLTVTSKSSGLSVAQIGSGSTAGDAWIDRYVSGAAAMNVPVMVTFDHEFEVKLNQRQLSPVPTLADYQRAFNRFAARMHAGAPKAKVGYWFGGSDKAKIDPIGSGLTGVDWIGYDPYSTDTHPASETFVQTVTPTLNWIKGRSWFKGQPIFLTEFGSDTAHGDASVAAYMTNLRTHLRTLGVAGAILFNRDRQDADGQFVRYKIDNGTTPRSLAAFAASMR